MNGCKNSLLVLLISLVLCLTIPACSQSRLTQWPEPQSQAKPWTRWWWLGSAVDEDNLTDLLSQYQKAGIGGVEICPIYGAKGYEQQFKEFLSPEWVNMFEHTLKKAKRMDIGVDMTAGTGWPFGGPMVENEIASSGLILERYELKDGQLTELLSKEHIQYLVAVSSHGERIDITEKIQDRKLLWTAPEGTWTLYAVAVKNPVQKVKRAAPGGEGYVLDPYSVPAMNSYLDVFDKAFKEYHGPMPRGWFHDSFEYYGATWTTEFFDEFQSRRGYDLHDYIEALIGEGPDDTVARVMCDYHETINDLHLEYIQHWTQWCHAKGGLSRNQAHGAPANLIDLYAAADIPETEIFRQIEDAQIPMLQLSSSSAHLNGNNLASSESFTWLKEHFQTSLADLKTATDFLFLTGVNHIFFHGIPYSPVEATWPGWQFYASVNFGPGGSLWHDLPAYNAYVTRCQSILQSGLPDNDILLYLPIYDFWQKREKLHMTFTVHNQHEWLYPSSYYRAAMSLWKKGYTYDAVSDQFLLQASSQKGKVLVNGTVYDVIIVPHCNVMPGATMEKLLELVRGGATVLFQDNLPSDVPGLFNHKQRCLDLQRKLEVVLPNIKAIQAGQDQLPAGQLKKNIGKGRLLLADLDSLLNKIAVSYEPAMESGICFVRRRSREGFNYFFVNRSQRIYDGWMTLGKDAMSVILMDPLVEDRVGWAALRNENNETQVYLQLQPNQSVFLKTFTNRPANDTPAWQYLQTSNAPSFITGTWDIQFIDGGPVLPKGYKTQRLTSWTYRDDIDTQRFFGTARYTIKFNAPNIEADDWLLDLGRVCQSARITLNGINVGTLWSEPFQVLVGRYLSSGLNTLEIEVTNLAANRIRDLDQNNINWKYFYDANVVSIDYKPLDASDWSLFDSGLLGPVGLVPLRNVSRSDLPEVIVREPLTLFIIGDSTVHNSKSGLQGWGDIIETYFDPSIITVKNCARGGRSSRTFQTEGLWDKVLNTLKPGDFVLMQFGHNDGGSLNTGRARGSLKGTGNDTEQVIMEASGQTETVHTYGWYMKKYIRDTKAKGAVPIVVSPIPRNRWKDGSVARASGDYGKWAMEAAREEDAFFIDLNELVAIEYEKAGSQQVQCQYFFEDHTHTTPDGARLNAETLMRAIRSLEDCLLSQHIKQVDLYQN